MGDGPAERNVDLTRTGMPRRDDRCAQRRRERGLALVGARMGLMMKVARLLAPTTSGDRRSKRGRPDYERLDTAIGGVASDVADQAQRQASRPAPANFESSVGGGGQAAHM